MRDTRPVLTENVFRFELVLLTQRNTVLELSLKLFCYLGPTWSHGWARQPGVGDVLMAPEVEGEV